MNKQRKQKLHARSLAYSNANQERGADSFSFEDGYRAAMRDLRKQLQDTERNTDTRLPMAIKRGLLLGTVRNFLLPLR